MPDDSFKEFVLDQLSALPELRYQFERLAYFALDKDSQLSTNNPQPIFNRIITLKDT